MNSCGSDKDFVVTITTKYGDIKAILYDETPLHKKNFIELAKEGMYDSTVFHRIMEEFMIQGGDIAKKPGFDGDNSDRIPAEFVKKYYHKRGALAAARQMDRVNPKKQSSWCQFYIVQGKVWTEEELTTNQGKLNAQVGRLIRIPEYDSIGEVLINLYEAGDFDAYGKLLLSLRPDVEKRLGVDVSQKVAPERLKTYTTVGGAPNLDDNYTVFGEVVEGLDIVDEIAAVETDQSDAPLEEIYMSVSVEEVPKKKITRLYGIEYPEEK